MLSTAPFSFLSVRHSIHKCVTRKCCPSQAWRVSLEGRSPSMATRWSGMNACISLREVIPQLQLHLCQCSLLTLRALIWEGPGRAQCLLCWWDSCGTHWGPGSGSWLGHRNGLRVGGQRGKWELTRHWSRLLSTVKETLTYHDICVHAGKFLFCFPAQWFLEAKIHLFQLKFQSWNNELCQSHGMLLCLKKSSRRSLDFL